jgi:hypothetical protein
MWLSATSQWSQCGNRIVLPVQGCGDAVVERECGPGELASEAKRVSDALEHMRPVSPTSGGEGATEGQRVLLRAADDPDPGHPARLQAASPEIYADEPTAANVSVSGHGQR